MPAAGNCLLEPWEWWFGHVGGIHQLFLHRHVLQSGAAHLRRRRRGARLLPDRQPGPSCRPSSRCCPIASTASTCCWPWRASTVRSVPAAAAGGSFWRCRGTSVCFGVGMAMLPWLASWGQHGAMPGRAECGAMFLLLRQPRLYRRPPCSPCLFRSTHHLVFLAGRVWACRISSVQLLLGARADGVGADAAADQLNGMGVREDGDVSCCSNRSESARRRR